MCILSFDFQNMHVWGFPGVACHYSFSCNIAVTVESAILDAGKTTLGKHY